MKRYRGDLSVQVLEARRLLSGGGDGIDEPHCVEVEEIDNYQTHATAGRWTTTASGSTGSTGKGITLTWSVVPDGTAMPSGNGEPATPSTLVSNLNAIYGSSTTWLPVLQEVFSSWSSITGITYVYQSTDDGATVGSASPGVLGVRGDVRLSAHPIDGLNGVLAYDYYPNVGDMVLDSGDLQGDGIMADTWEESLALTNIVAHEHGHGLGLRHVDPMDNTKLMEAYLTLIFRGPQFDDMLGAQRAYGDVYEKGAGNNTAATATDRGTLGDGTDSFNNAAVSTTSDLDYYRITIPAARNVTVTLTPWGPTYEQGAYGGATSTFDASALMDLRVQLLASDGVTILADGNANGVGVAEATSTVKLAAGTYYVKVLSAIGASNTWAQAYSLDTTVSLPNGVWTGAADNMTWSHPGNWSNYTIPGPNDDVVIDVASNPTIVLSGSENVRSILSSESLWITGWLNISASSTFNASVGLNGTLAGSGSVTFASTFEWINGPMYGSGTTTIASTGSMTVYGSGERFSERPLVVNGFAELAAGGNRTLRLPSLSVPGTMDLRNHSMVVDYSGTSPASDLQSRVRSGYQDGAWTGAGIRSSVAATIAGDGIALTEASSVYPAFPASYAGVTIDNTCILFGYSILGDADLNRAVNTLDFNTLAANFGAALKLFSDGDFDYSGTVDSSDFNLYVGQYGRKMTAPGSLPSSSLFSAASSSAGEKDLIDLVV